MEIAHLVGILGVVIFGWGIRQKDTDIRSSNNRKTPIVIGIAIVALSFGWMAYKTIIEHS